MKVDSVGIDKGFSPRNLYAVSSLYPYLKLNWETKVNLYL
jgi:hypothetical protein